jgi:hypothetical protein
MGLTELAFPKGTTGLRAGADVPRGLRLSSAADIKHEGHLYSSARSPRPVGKPSGKAAARPTL